MNLIVPAELLIVALFGAFGGLIFFVRQLNLNYPPFDKLSENLSEGKFARILIQFISDVLSGILGSLAIFLIIPLDIGLVQSGSMNGSISIIALAALGGYAGSSVIDKALPFSVRDIADKQRAQGNRISELENQLSVDREVILLAKACMQETNPSNDIRERFSKLLQKSSNFAKENLYREAQQYRHASFRNNEKEKIGRVIFIFESILNCKGCENYFWCYGQLGFALKDKIDPEYKKSIEALSTAIDIRTRLGNRDPDGGYHFNRAVALICYGIETESLESKYNEILGDLAISFQNARMIKWAEETEQVRSWLGANHLDPETVKAGGKGAHASALTVSKLR